ncbi:alpha/beta fold hydrolase [Hoeflea prorocentri]|uniref:Alpha/beta hydrolase n=1 Tax=Hoeflea prorocentri TaxID=1922333 RepID=A0A9X3ULA1_9HYPH|nr:alpha/beta hydrolase [Hoeflea prorocentri]MCY6382657.1 alpha/beta hydrolase [Hoeflea prorocentri]MDA5400457.1 alpha/beta hydrolase [Hoeflea prorocentri]
MNNLTLKIGDQTTACRTGGAGPSTVVLLSGLGEGMKTWDGIASSLESHVQIFTYDRPGYGGSSHPPDCKDSRDGRFVADHLKACLDAAEIQPPYILTGHSMGGLYALAFVKAHRELVSGLVLIDSRMPAFSSACLSAGLSPEPRWFFKLLFPRQLKAEVRGAIAAEQQAARPEDLHGLPVTAIVASRRDKGMSEPMFEIFRQLQLDFVRQTELGRVVISESSGHYVHQEDPSLVTEEILRVAREH